MACPFCGSSLVPGLFDAPRGLVYVAMADQPEPHVEGEREFLQRHVHFTACLNCGARGPYDETRDGALKRWNVRAAPKPTVTHEWIWYQSLRRGAKWHLFQLDCDTSICEAVKRMPGERGARRPALSDRRCTRCSAWARRNNVENGRAVMRGVRR